MPVIKRTAPLLPEGEYVGQARKVNMEWSKPKRNPDGTMTAAVPVFRIPLHTHDGRSITTFARVMDSTGWVWEQMAKSGEMEFPEGREFVVNVDDLENRVFYFGVNHQTYNGAPIANVRFHAKSYAVQQNPSLATVSFPNAAPPTVLRKPPGGGSAPAAPAPAPVTPPTLTSPSVAKAEEPPSPPAAGFEGVSEAQLAALLEELKRRQQEGK